MKFYPRCLTREESSEWIHRRLLSYESHGHGLWLVEHADSGAPVGQVGLVPQVIDGEAESEIGWMIASAPWRNGYAIEAAGLRRRPR